MKKIDDPSIQVAFQATLTLGNFHDDSVVEALTQVLMKYGKDQWFQMAILSSNDGSSIELLKSLKDKENFFSEPVDWKFDFIRSFAHVTGSRNEPNAILFLTDALLNSKIEKSWQEPGASGLLEGLKKSATSDQIKEALVNIEKVSTSDSSAALQQLRALYSKPAL